MLLGSWPRASARPSHRGIAKRRFYDTSRGSHRRQARDSPVHHRRVPLFTRTQQRSRCEAVPRRPPRTLGVPPSHSFETTKVFADGDATVVRVSQHIGGVAIFESDVAVNVSADNQVKVVSGKFYSAEFDTVATITEEAAIAGSSYELGEPELVEPPSAELVGLVDADGGTLTWHVTLTTFEADGSLGQWHCLIDAHNGSLLRKYNGMRHAINRETYDMHNTTTLTSATLAITEGGTSKDKVIQATHDNIGVVYDYYLNNHGRDGADGLGRIVETYVHWGVDFVGAFAGTLHGHGAMLFGDGSPNSQFPYGTALDIVAHEYTHLVVNFTANLGGREQSVALNESLADVFATFVDADDFLIGEDLFQQGLFTNTRALESISDPPQLGNQPDHMSRYWLDTDIPLDQHKNAGITNKAYYNIVTQLGRAATAQIYYRALSVYMTTTTDFVGARLALEQAASDLFGPTSTELAAVQAGFSAVGIFHPASDFIGTFVADPNPSFNLPDSNGMVRKTYTHPGASAMKVNFSHWFFPGRTVYLRDGTGTVVYSYKTEGRPGANFVSGPVPGDTVTIEFYPAAFRPWPQVDGYFFDDLDLLPPVLSSAPVTIVDPFTATITWSTDERTDGQVLWGETSAYGNATPLQPFKTFDHSVTIDTLMPGTTYNFLAESVDYSGNLGNSGNLSFSTPAASDVLTIDRAQWPAFGELRVEATTTDPSATVSVYFGDGQFIETMDANGKGRHRLRIAGFVNPRRVDSEIMLRSSSGGFDYYSFPALP